MTRTSPSSTEGDAFPTRNPRLVHRLARRWTREETRERFVPICSEGHSLYLPLSLFLSRARAFLGIFGSPAGRGGAKHHVDSHVQTMCAVYRCVMGIVAFKTIADEYRWLRGADSQADWTRNVSGSSTSSTNRFSLARARPPALSLSRLRACPFGLDPPQLRQDAWPSSAHPSVSRHFAIMCMGLSLKCP